LTLEQDWDRVFKVYEQVRNAHWCPRLVISLEIYDLRKVDQGIDYPLRRLLDSDYRKNIRTYGAPSSEFGRHPFISSDGRHWLLIRVTPKEDSTNANQEKAKP
jgi:hypothetical protein